MALFKRLLKIFGIIAILMAIGAIVLVLFIAKKPLVLKTATVAINQERIRVEIADSPIELYRGLSGRQGLCPDCGMLFNFSDSEEQEFVMRNMNFPLDIIFMNHGQIINIAADLAPEGNNPSKIYDSGGPTDQVLEVNGGYAARRGLKVGDRISVINTSAE